MVLFMKVAAAALFLLVSSICDANSESTTSQFSSANGTQAIIGGSEASAGEYPWFAKAVSANENWAGCGGALVSPQFVLTAAHCLGIFNGFEIGAFCHSKNGSPNGNCGQASEIIDAIKNIAHPDYDEDTYDNDFALIKLEKAAQATPIAMDSNELSGSYTTAKKLWPVGFGNTRTDGSENFPEKLNHVSVSYVPNDTCNSAYGAGSITSDMMCAADPDEDSCQGDSGGPLYDKDNNLLVGVVSWGFGCADPNFPGVYSRISSRWSWIVDTICSDNDSAKPGFCDGLTSSPSSTPVSCTDSPPGWHDIGGTRYDCEYYRVGNNCEDEGDDYENDGATANQACCVCGGGKKSSPVSTPSSSPVAKPFTSSPTSSPVAKPFTSSPTSGPVAKPFTPSPTSSPVAKPFTSSPTSTSVSCTESPPGWDDSDGDSCESYASGNDWCAVFGDDFKNDGATANEACCACGGGKDPSDSSPSSSPVENPTGEDLCQDNDEKFQYSAMNEKNCKFIGNKNTDLRCNKHNGVGKENCPVTCKTGCTCYDTEGAILLSNGITKTCNWAANNTEQRCKRNDIRANCPIVCGLC